MLTLYGVIVAPEDARHLVATLIADGGPDAITAAALIDGGIDRSLHDVDLLPAERDAILSVLEDPPAGLVVLRGKLARDHRSRSLPRLP